MSHVFTEEVRPGDRRRAVRMYGERRQDVPGEAAPSTQRRVGGLLDVNPAALRVGSSGPTSTRALGRGPDRDGRGGPVYFGSVLPRARSHTCSILRRLPISRQRSSSSSPRASRSRCLWPSHNRSSQGCHS